MEVLERLELKIERYKFDRVEEYVELINSLYPELIAEQQQKWVKKMLNPSNPFFAGTDMMNFLIPEKGHISALVDERYDNIGIIGFYDCVDDLEVSKLLFDEALQWLKQKGVTEIIGPISLSIWHQYRVPLNGINILDPISKAYYKAHFEAAGFTACDKFVSALRKDASHVLSHPDDIGIIEGLEIKEFNHKMLKDLLLLSNKIFKGGKGFIELKLPEFNYLYEDMINSMDTSLTKIAYVNKKPAGFVFALRHPIKDQIIVKTIGVVKEYREKGLGNSLLQEIHKVKVKSYYYPLIRVGNDIFKLPYEGYEIVNNYELYSTIISSPE